MSERRAFAMIDLVLVLIVVLIIVALVVAMGPRRRTHAQINNTSCIRWIHQGMVLWTQNNQGRYPLPSALDASNATVALKPGEDPTVKDTTAAVVSALIYGNYFGPEICISPAESNGNVTLDADYRYIEPPTAENPKLALWDPAFSADFTKPGGNLSFAFAMPTGKRLALWSETGSATQAVLGNRGPQITSIAKGAAPGITPTFDLRSNTMLILGARNSWEGDIGYNDGHVDRATTLWGPATYTDASGTSWNDLFFADEPDDPAGMNNYLGVFTTAGAKAKDFTPIWD